MTTKAEQTVQLAAQALQIADLQRQIKEAGWIIEGEQTRWTQLAMECNAIYGMLDDLFGFKVYGAPYSGRQNEPEWIIEDKETKEILVERCKPLAVAYHEAITKRLESTNTGTNNPLH